MALGSLRALGTISYGDFTFGPETETMEFTITPVYDVAGRTVVASRWTLVLRFYLEGTPADNTVRQVVGQLTRPADVLLNFGRGTPPLKVNLFEQRDAEYGPRPASVSLKAHGNLTTEVTWKVQFTLATCDDRVFSGIMEFNYRLTFDIDRRMYTTRTYRGHVVIAQTRLRPGDRRLPPGSADDTRELVIPNLLPGFRRVSQTWELDESKRRADFSVVDEQLPPNPPPKGIIDWSAEHTYSAQGAGLLKWVGTLSAEYEAAWDQDWQVMAAAWNALLTDRLIPVRKMPLAHPDGLGDRDGHPAIIPIATTVSEPNIAGPLKARFSITYSLAGVNLRQVMLWGGLWRWVPDPGAPVAPPAWKNPMSVAPLEGVTNAKRWQEFEKEIMGPRGALKLRFRTDDDKIIDLCGGDSALSRNPGGILPPRPRGVVPPVGIPTPKYGGGNSGQPLFKSPSVAGSWMNYRNDVTVRPDTGAVVAKTLPTTPITPRSQSSGGIWSVSDGISTLPRDGFPYPPLAGTIDPNADDVAVQHRTRPTLYITMSGFAMRAGWSIPCPVLTDVNGVRPVLVNRDSDEGFRHGIVADPGFGIPIYGAVWKQTYVLTEMPSGGISVPPNPTYA